MSDPSLPAILSYENAKKALAELRRVDEVKQILNKAIAMQIYAQQAKDQTLINHATDVRMRSEIRAGELLREMKVRGERAKPGDAGGGTDSSGVRPSVNPTLSDLGVTKTQSSRWQKLASLAPDEQEAKIEKAKAKAAEACEPKERGPSSSLKLAPSASDPIERFVTGIIQKINEKAETLTKEQWAHLFSELRKRLEYLAFRFVGVEESTSADTTKRQSA